MQYGIDYFERVNENSYKLSSVFAIHPADENDLRGNQPSDISRNTRWVDRIYCDGAEGGIIEETENWFSIRDWVDGHIIWFCKDPSLLTFESLTTDNIHLLDQFDEDDYLSLKPSTFRIHVHKDRKIEGVITVGKLRHHHKT